MPMKIDGTTLQLNSQSGGNVGIGTTSPQTLFHLNAPASTNATIYFGVNNTMNGYFGQTASAGSLSSTAAIGDVVLRSQSNLLFTAGGDTERMRVGNGGGISIGTAVPNDAYRLLIHGVDSTSANYCLVIRNSTPSNLIYVRNDGYLYSVGAWSGSDRRLKENITDLSNGLNKILGLKARKFDFIDGFKDQYGFVAQEVQEVIPDAVSVFQEEDQMLAVKMDFITPHLVKAIQELSTKLDQANTKIAALEAK
jgi:hypothetical protein